MSGPHIITSTETAEQIQETYRRLVKEAKYAPMAPSDGMGTVIGDIDVETEAKEYVAYWWEQEENQSYFSIGCPNWPDRPALIFAVEACHNLCGMNKELAIKLLRMAADELER